MRPLQALTAFGEECERDEHYDGHGDNKYIKHTVPPRELVIGYVPTFYEAGGVCVSLRCEASAARRSKASIGKGLGR
jgi:hypothetical protein